MATTLMHKKAWCFFGSHGGFVAIKTLHWKGLSATSARLITNQNENGIKNKQKKIRSTFSLFYHNK